MILQIILLRQQLQPLLLQLCHNLVCQTPLYSAGKRNIIHLACQYIYFPLLVLFLFAAVEQSTLSIQLVFLGADEWKQKERHARITEISTLQDRSKYLRRRMNEQFEKKREKHCALQQQHLKCKTSLYRTLLRSDKSAR